MRQFRVVTLILLLAISSILLTRSILVQGQPEADAPSNAYIRFWRHEDIITLDPWGDTPTHPDDAHDLVALYLKDSPPGEPLRFRLDVLDMKGDAPVDAYLALDWTDGGARALVPGGPPTTDLDWDLLLVLPADGPAVTYTPDFTPHPDAITDSARDTTLDYLTVTLDPSALPNPLMTPFQMQALLAPSGGSPTDRTTPVTSDATSPEPAIMTMNFGNVMGYPTPAGIVSEYDRQDQDRDGTTRNWGLRYLLDAVEKYRLPISLMFKQVTWLPGEEYVAGILERVRRLAEEGLLALPDETSYGHFMAWQPQDVDAKAISIARQIHRQLDLPPSPVFIPYEFRITLADLETIRQAGYRAVITPGYDQMYIFENLTYGESTLLGRKLHRINGVLVLFLTQRWNWDDRWEEVDWETWDEYEYWRGTDGGLHLWNRRILLDMALDPDREQFHGYHPWDYRLTPWGFEGVADANFRWIAEHPWIRFVTVEDLLDMGWTPIEDGDLGLAPEDYLHRFTVPGDTYYNAYFQWFYHGGVSDGHSPLIPEGVEIEAYFDYVPFLRDGQPIPSGREMGDNRTPGTIIYETLRNLRSAPENSLTTLAWLAYFEAIAEKTLHTTKRVQPYDREHGDLGGAYLHPWAKMHANQLRQVNKIVAAARWAEDVATGRQPEETLVVVVDLDLDGEDEYVMKNSKVFAVFEDDGGRLEYAFGYDPGVGPVQLVAPLNQFHTASQGPVIWDWTEGEVQEQFWSDTFTDVAFVESLDPDELNYGFSAFDAELSNKSLTFLSADGRINKTFTLPDGGNTIHARYSTRPSDQAIVGFGLAVNPLNMWTRNWDEKIAEVSFHGAVGWKVEEGGYAVVKLMDTTLPEGGVISSFLDSPAKEDMRQIPGKEYAAGDWSLLPYTVVRVQGSGEFSVGLTLSARALKPPEFLVADLVIAPTEAETGENITVSLKVTNIGEQSGSHDVSLNINGITTETKMVTLAEGENTTVNFTVTRNAAGTYNVDVDGLKGTFEISKPAKGIGIIIAMLVIAAVAAAFILRKHAR